MKTRIVSSASGLSLILKDAYGNPRGKFPVRACEFTELPLPHPRDKYVNEDDGRERFVYDGEGVWEDLDLFVPDFEVNEETSEAFDSFALAPQEAPEKFRPLIDSVLTVIELNETKPGYVRIKRVDELIDSTLAKAGVTQ